MRKIVAFFTALSVLCIATSCGTKIDNAEKNQDYTSESGSIEESSELNDDNTSESESETDTESTSETESGSEGTSESNNDDDSSANNSLNNNKTASNSSSYDYNLSDSQLLSKAQTMFDNAVEEYNKFIYEGAYSMDDSKLYFSTSGESMLKITDSSVKSISDIVEDFEEYFSEKYEDPVPMHYIQSGGELYYIQSDRGDDISYESTKITEITKKTEDEIFFNAVSSYSDGSEKTFEYSLVYNENGVEWKTGVFTFPE